MKAKSDLESTVIKSKEIVKLDENMKYLSDQEITVNNLITNKEYNMLLDTISKWMAADSLKLADYRSKQTQFDNFINLINLRRTESLNRPEMAEKLKNLIVVCEDSYKNWKNNPIKDIQRDIETFGDITKSTKKWIEGKLEKQSLLKITETPVLLCKDMKEKIKVLKSKLKSINLRFNKMKKTKNIEKEL